MSAVALPVANSDRRTLDATGHTANNFDFLRLLAASAVLFSHCFAISAQGGNEPLVAWTHGAYTFGGVAVRVFFVISGFLVTSSWLRYPRVIPFATARALRIFPALAAALAYCVLVGLFTTSLTKAQFLAHPDTWHFFWNNLTLRTEFFLPGVFHDNPFPDAVNGSLWSLYYEVRAYLIVLGLGVLSLMKNRFVAIAAWLGVAAVVFLYPAAWGMTQENDWPVINVCLCFVGGALIALYPRVLHGPWLGVVALASAATIPFLLGTHYADIPMNLLLVSGTLWLAYCRIPHLQFFGKFGDFSYGIFIYAFPTQQLFAWWGIGSHNAYVLLIVAFPVTLLLAVFSWHCIERPCRDLRRYFRKPRPATAAAGANQG